MVMADGVAELQIRGARRLKNSVCTQIISIWPIFSCRDILRSVFSAHLSPSRVSQTGPGSGGLSSARQAPAGERTMMARRWA